MKAHEIFNLIVCLIVYIALTGLFTFLIATIIKLTLSNTRAGLEDDKIKAEYIKEQTKGNRAAVKALNFIVDKVFPILVSVILGVMLCLSLYSKNTQNNKVGTIPTVKVVETGSMESKHKSNSYLFTNNLNNQIQVFDLVVIHQLPKEEDLKLYDIVVYEIQGYYIIHRIVGIEEPNEKHPNERWFALQGDANNKADDFPVRYSQMTGIYYDEKVPFAGSFVVFMQSPAGILCFMLAVYGIIATEIIERKLKKERAKRLEIIFATDMAVTSTLETGEQQVDQLVEEQQVIEQQFEGVTDGEEVEEGSTFSRFANAQRLTFAEKVKLLDADRKLWLEQIISIARTIPNANEKNSKNSVSFAVKNKTAVKLCISRGYVYTYIAVDAKEYLDKKQYAVKDMSNVSAYANCPTRLKITSQRKVKCVEQILINKFGASKVLNLTSTYYGRKKRTFKYKVSRLDADKKAWYKQIVQALEQKPKLTKRESKNSITFKRGLTPITKIGINGKSLRIYLNVDYKQFTGRQYGAIDVSNVKAHSLYPTMFKITSNRKVKNVINIINSL